MDAQWIGCASENFRKGRPLGFKPEAVVVHIIVGSLTSADQHFNDPSSAVSAHYGVGKNGKIHQYVQEADTAFHAGIVVRPTWALIKPNVNPNFYTIGIEHEGQPMDAWSETQMCASAALIGEVTTRWRIPLDRDHVIMHRQIRSTKTCPGEFIQIEDLLKRVPATRGIQVSGTPTTVTFLTNTNVRAGAPATTSPIVRVDRAGTAANVGGYVIGESINGNAYWYCEAITGNFFWAGATTIPSPGEGPTK